MTAPTRYASHSANPRIFPATALSSAHPIRIRAIKERPIEDTDEYFKCDSCAADDFVVVPRSRGIRRCLQLHQELGPGQRRHKIQIGRGILSRYSAAQQWRHESRAAKNIGHPKTI